MNIVLINPPFKVEYGKFSRDQRSPAITKSGTLYYPTWLASATGVLEESGHKCKLMDCCAVQMADDKALQIIKDFSPSMIVINTSTPSIYNDCLFAEKVKNKDGALFIVAVFNRIVNDDLLLTAINMFVEVFDRCSIFENDLVVADKRVRFNWEILPPGERPSIHIIKILRDKKQDTDTFDVERLRTLEKYKAEIIGEGINGFYGYYAFVFNNICILESAFYGNATYIIPKENWEILSQKTKQELFNNNLLLSKIIHNESWQSRLRVEFRKFEP